MKKIEQLPIYSREFCVQKGKVFIHTVVQAHRPITDDELTFKAAYAAKECASLYGGKWIAHAGMTAQQMVLRRNELVKAG